MTSVWLVASSQILRQPLPGIPLKILTTFPRNSPTASATTKPLGLPTYGVRSHSNATNLGETAGKESEDGTMAQNAGHVGIASVAVTQGQTRTGKKGGRMERARDLDGGENRDEGRSVGGDVGVHVPVYAGPKYGYASLRKIREQEPSPTVSKTETTDKASTCLLRRNIAVDK